MARKESNYSHLQAIGPGRVALYKLNLDGDRQADLSVHGEVISREPNDVRVSAITRLYAAKRYGDADVAWV